MRKTILIILAIIFSVFEYGVAQSTQLYEIGTKDSLYSNTLEEQRVIWVQLPESYRQESEQLYPVIYVLDGAVHFQAVSTVLSYNWGGFMPEMIIVGISNRNNRTRDLTTSEIQTRRGAEYNQETGGAENFTLFIEKELIPHIEASYPATTYRTLIGHSYAGLFTINMLVKHSDVFDNYLAIDPSLDWDEQKLLNQSKEILSTRDYHGKALFMSLSGQLHMQNSDITIENVMQDSSDYTLFARSNIEFSNFVTKNEHNGLSYQWKFYEQDLHGTVSLPSILDGLKFLFNWYPIENTDMFNSPDTPTDELIQMIRKREKKLKDHFGYKVPPFDEELLIMLGYMNLEWGNPQKSLALFQLALEYYPDSAEALKNIKELQDLN
ncbi:MAG: alpha/beta hydrolase [Bacteroidales bacterium]|nr:alpha/beta hydrolase [Bacteroidales bacterium]